MCMAGAAYLLKHLVQGDAHLRIYAGAQESFMDSVRRHRLPLDSRYDV